MDKGDTTITGLVPVIRMLWLLGLIPVARGVAHLLNGIFFAPKPEKEPEPQIGFAPDFAPATAQNHIQPPTDILLGGRRSGDEQLGWRANPTAANKRDRRPDIAIRTEMTSRNVEA